MPDDHRFHPDVRETLQGVTPPWGHQPSAATPPTNGVPPMPFHLHWRHQLEQWRQQAWDWLQQPTSWSGAYPDPYAQEPSGFTPPSFSIPGGTLTEEDWERLRNHERLQEAEEMMAAANDLDDPPGDPLDGDLKVSRF